MNLLIFIGCNDLDFRDHQMSELGKYQLKLKVFFTKSKCVLVTEF